MVKSIEGYLVQRDFKQFDPIEFLLLGSAGTIVLLGLLIVLVKGINWVHDYIAAHPTVYWLIIPAAVIFVTIGIIYYNDTVKLVTTNKKVE